MTRQKNNQIDSSAPTGGLDALVARIEMGGWDVKFASQLKDGVRVYRATVWQHGVVWGRKENASTSVEAIMAAWKSAEGQRRKLKRPEREGT